MSTRIIAALSAIAAVLVLITVAWIGSTYIPLAEIRLAQAQSQPISETLELAAQQDSWVDEQNPTTNYGDDEDLYVGLVNAQVAPFENETLVQFNLEKLPPDATILSATLELFQLNWWGSRSYTIWPVAIAEPWEELKVTWNNKPPVHPDITGPAATLDFNGGWKIWDVTDIVQTWADGKIENEGILLYGDEKTVGGRIFASREHPEQIPPRLYIEYVRPTPTPTSTPTITPTSTPTITP
ncbi:MAG: DNRLRE domain-containing protein, partial [Chloroflexaceae bacterium]|nr:DNRLRE domain-containing protein [Chloroflexaceae bacterium]